MTSSSRQLELTETLLARVHRCAPPRCARGTVLAVGGLAGSEVPLATAQSSQAAFIAFLSFSSAMMPIIWVYGIERTAAFERFIHHSHSPRPGDAMEKAELGSVLDGSGGGGDDYDDHNHHGHDAEKKGGYRLFQGWGELTEAMAVVWPKACVLCAALLTRAGSRLIPYPPPNAHHNVT